MADVVQSTPVSPLPDSDGAPSVSTHVSNDDFLNDDAIPITQNPEASSGAVPRISNEDDGAPPRPDSPPQQGSSSVAAPGAAAVLSAPLSFGTVSASSKRRNSMWKAEPDNALAAIREACMGATNNVRVDAARKVVAAARQRVNELEGAMASLKESVEAVRSSAQSLPSTRMPRYEHLMFASDPEFGGAAHHHSASAQDGTGGAGDEDRSFRDLIWSERIWDVEAMLAEHRLDAAVTAVESLLADDGYDSCSQTVSGKVNKLADLIGHQLVARCPCSSAEDARAFAALLVRLDKADTACTVVLQTAEELLHSKLVWVQPNANNDLARYVQTVLQWTSAHFDDTHAAVENIPLSDAARAERFVSWTTAQTDRVYRGFVRSSVSLARGLNGGAFLQIASAIHSNGVGGAASALFRARLLSNLRAHLWDVARDVADAMTRCAIVEKMDNETWPPRAAQTLVRDADSAMGALAPVLRSLPALDEGEVDEVMANALMTYATRLYANDDAQVGKTLAYVGKNVGESVKRHGMNAPRTGRWAGLLTTASKEKIMQQVQTQRDNGERKKTIERRASVGVTRLNLDDFTQEAVNTTEADEAELKEKARQMLAQHRWAAAAAATIAVGWRHWTWTVCIVSLHITMFSMGMAARL